MADSNEPKPLGDGEKALSATAGALAGVWLAVFVGVVTTIASPLLRRSTLLSGAARLLVGVRPEEDKQIGDFMGRAGVGAMLGCGLLLTLAALNWTVEQVDAISGENKE